MEILAALFDRVRTAPAPDDRPLTIAEIYQRIIPYRTVREELGVLEFAAYEHALLRLLAGEGRLLQVRDPQVREELQRELASVNPILGIYRDYGEAPVELMDGVPGAAVAVEAPTPRAVDAPQASSAGSSTPRPAPAPPRRSDAPSSDPGAMKKSREAPGPSHCRACDELLPGTTGLRFCPFCGEAQDPRPCAECGTPLEGAWSFCIRCGARRA